MSQSRYQELSKSLARARESFGAYRSECFFFASQLARGFTEYSGWPRELVTYEAVGAGDGGPTARVEDAIHLDQDGFWHFGLRLTVEEPKGSGSILLLVRFKKIESRYIVSIERFDDFEVTTPITTEQLQPIYDSILNAVKRHFDYGLRLFLENGGRGLKIPVSAEDLSALVRPPDGG